MGTTTALRLGAGLFTFAVVARLLGPESFGVLMLWLSVSALATIVTNYGLNSYVLREIGANPSSAETVMNEGITGKLLLTGLVLVCALLAVGLLDIKHSQVFLCLLLASIADCFTEFLNAGFRARSRFDIETRIATVCAVTHAVIVSGLVYLNPTVYAAAAAYTASRVLVLAITIPAVSKYFSKPSLVSFTSAVKRLRAAFFFAIDFGFNSLFGQVDSLVLNHFIGPIAVGLYQAGFRIFQAGNQASTILSNVFLPRASATHSSIVLFSKENHRLQIAFLTIGSAFGLALAALAKPVVVVLFGSGFIQLVELMPFFGLLFFLRFSAAAWGIVLTAAGEQGYRTVFGILQWLVVITSAMYFVPQYSIIGWLMSLCIGTMFLTIGYIARGWRYLERYWEILSISIFGGVIFIPFVWIH